jgi:hypothetical protein
MELKNKKKPKQINRKDIQYRIKKIKNTLINLKKVNLFYIKFINNYRAMILFFFP